MYATSFSRLGFATGKVRLQRWYKVKVCKTFIVADTVV